MSSGSVPCASHAPLVVNRAHGVLTWLAVCRQIPARGELCSQVTCKWAAGVRARVPVDAAGMEGGPPAELLKA